MPEYMTKSEPVDKKPYIVYTTESGILYSDDPNSDVPGGGGVKTATLTVTNNSGKGINILCLFLVDAPGGTGFAPLIPLENNGVGTYTVLIGNTGTLGLVLHNQFDDDIPSLVVDGDIKNDDGEFIITGNGSITVA